MALAWPPPCRHGSGWQITTPLSIDDLPKSYFGARLTNATFGTYGSKPACLLVIQLDFLITISNAYYRFHEATVDAEFTDGVIPTFPAPRVVQLAPKIEEDENYSLRTTYMTLGAMPGTLSFGGPIPGAFGVATTTSHRGQQIIQGVMRGSPATGAVWSIIEDRVSKSGIPRFCKIGVIVTYTEHRRFIMTVQVKALAKGGLPVKGSTRPILFDPALYEIPFGLQLEERNLEELCSKKA